MTDLMKLATDYAQACYNLANPDSYGARGVNKPPEGHWLNEVWDIARAEAAQQAQEPVDKCVTWTTGPNEWKDWCAQWFGPDADDDYLAKAVFALPPMAQNFKLPAPKQAEPAELIEIMCARIKAADDACADMDYMLDSNDCIKVIRGEWKGPVAQDHPPTPPEAK